MDAMNIAQIVGGAVGGLLIGASTFAAWQKAREKEAQGKRDTGLAPLFGAPLDRDGVPMVPSRDDPRRFVPLARSEDVDRNGLALQLVTREIHDLRAEVRDGFRGINARLYRAGINGAHEPPHPFETTGEWPVPPPPKKDPDR